MATRYLISGGTGNWNSTTNWSATSGGASGASFPVLGDDVICDKFSNTNLTINVASVCTSFSASPAYTNSLIATNNFTFSGSPSTITFSTGMTISGAGQLGISGNTTVTTNGKYWTGNFAPVKAGVMTLNDNFNLVGNIAHSTTGGFFAINGNTFNIGGNITLSSGRSLSGTTLLNLVGNGIVTCSGLIQNNLSVASTGTTTLGAITYNTGTITYVSGTTNITGVLSLTNSTAFQTSGMTWGDVTFQTTQNQIATLNSTLNIGGLLTGSIAMQFSGNSGFNTSSFSSISAGRTLTFQTGITYTVTSGLTVTGTLGSPILFSSSTANQTAKFNLNFGATQDLGFCSATDIDSSGGQPIYSYRGTLTRTTNWKNLTTPTTIGTIF